MKELRVFYLQGEVTWTHGLKGQGIFPNSIDDDLKKLPSGTKCLTLNEPDKIAAFMSSDRNSVENDKLIIGEPGPEPEPEPEPEPPRDPLAEIDNMRTKLEQKLIL
ncbi:hypothetical protein ES708_34148 [subsurface metagenome]